MLVIPQSWAQVLGVIIFTDNPTVHETQLVLGELRARGIPTMFRAPWDISLPEIPEYDADLVYAPSNMLNRGSTFELIHRHLILKELEEERLIRRIPGSVDRFTVVSKDRFLRRIKKLNETEIKKKEKEMDAALTGLKDNIHKIPKLVKEYNFRYYSSDEEYWKIYNAAVRKLKKGDMYLLQ